MREKNNWRAISDNNLHVCVRICRQEGMNTVLTCTHPHGHGPTIYVGKCALAGYSDITRTHIHRTVVPCVAENYSMTVI